MQYYGNIFTVTTLSNAKTTPCNVFRMYGSPFQPVKKKYSDKNNDVTW